MIHFITDITLKHLPQDEKRHAWNFRWKGILQVTREGFQQDEAVTRAGGFGGIFNGLQRAPSASCTALHPGR